MEHIGNKEAQKQAVLTPEQHQCSQGGIRKQNCPGKMFHRAKAYPQKVTMSSISKETEL